jgi:hypothetical protein
MAQTKLDLTFSALLKIVPKVYGTLRRDIKRCRKHFLEGLTAHSKMSRQLFWFQKEFERLEGKVRIVEKIKNEKKETKNENDKKNKKR